MSAALAGRRDLPETNLRKRTRSSRLKSSKVFQSQMINSLSSVVSRYLTQHQRNTQEQRHQHINTNLMFVLSMSKLTSGIPQTKRSNRDAVRRVKRGNGMIREIPSRTHWTFQMKIVYRKKNLSKTQSFIVMYIKPLKLAQNSYLFVHFMEAKFKC